MFAAQGAAQLDYAPKKRLDRRVDTGLLVGIVPQEVHVEIAVAGVTVGRDHQLVLFGQLGTVAEEVGYLGARNHDVFRELVLGLALEAVAELAARCPKALAFPTVLCDQYLQRVEVI
ncbi:MAG: hypothetical protein JRF54_10070 [Deltaproteobacteria bacterium]|nr:hypothetical protein [Deltaproteobacteria bacterium]